MLLLRLRQEQLCFSMALPPPVARNFLNMREDAYFRSRKRSFESFLKSQLNGAVDKENLKIR